MTRRFKGTDKEYNTLHRWVEKQLGKPQECENCGITEGRFEWANISDDYKKDVSDWARLCKRCHRYFDNDWFIQRSAPVTYWKSEYCLSGHRLTIDNLYLKVKTGFIECRTCRYQTRADWGSDSAIELKRKKSLEYYFANKHKWKEYVKRRPSRSKKLAKLKVASNASINT